MASLRQGSRSRNSQSRQAEICLGGVRAVFWPQVCGGNKQGRLPRLSYRQKAGRQYGQDGIGNVARLSEFSQDTAKHMASTGIKAEGRLAHKRTDHDIAGKHRRAARPFIRNTGGHDQRPNERVAGSHLGSREFRFRFYRPGASGPNQDQQAAHHCPDGQKGANSLAGSPQGAIIGSCHRVWREARGERPEGAYIGIYQKRCEMQPAYFAAYSGRLDGSKDGADVAHIAIHGAYDDQSHRKALRPIFAGIYAGGRRCAGLVKYIGTCLAKVHIPCNPQKIWWAMTGSNRRHLRCKRTLPAQICQIHTYNRRCFANIGTFCSRFVAKSCTYGTYRAETGLQSYSSPDHNTKEPCNG